MARAKVTKPRLNGERGLVVAIIAQATNDAVGARLPEDRADARAYFANGRYQHDLGLLGLPGDWLPAEFERSDL